MGVNLIIGGNESGQSISFCFMYKPMDMITIPWLLHFACENNQENTNFVHNFDKQKHKRYFKIS